jgi:hypothetical protein
LRQVEIKDLVPVDPSRTSLPEEWKSFPAYLITGDSKMSFLQKNRGNPSPVPNRLKLKREIWLDEQGTGLTAHDFLSGTMTRGWRLNVDPSQTLGKADVEGHSRLITKLDTSDKVGVEVRQGSLALHAESRINRAVKNGTLEIPALGWDHDFQDLSAVLNLPPGWKLLTASGVDKVSTWLNQWTLLDIFIVLITGLATAKILGVGWGGVAVLFLLFSYHQPGAPRYFWLPLLATISIQQIITSTKAEKLCRIGGIAILFTLIVSSVPYMVHEIRVGIYPQLEYGNYHRITEDQKMNYELSQPDIAPMEEAKISKSKTNRTRKQYYSMGSGVAQNRVKKIQIDPQEMIQTGPGLPEWSWTKIQLSWNGPVTPEQNISLIFISPLNNTILAFMRVVLLTLLTGGFLRQCFILGKTPRKPVKTAALGLFFCFLLPLSLLPQSSNAEIPSQEILEELQSRLLKAPECDQQCATINSCMIRIDNKELLVELELDALVRGAVALPGENRFFDAILVNGEPSEILRLNDQGNSLIRLEPGSHTVLLKKELAGREKLSFSFPVLPERGQAILDNWNINGLHTNGRLDKQISLNRVSIHR